MRKKLLATIGYSSQESTGSHSKPTFEKESQRFRVELRKKDFLNPSKLNPVFESLDGNNKLSESMKTFTFTAQALRINYIKEKLGSKKSSGIFRPIPVTVDEDEKYSAEQLMSRKELLNVIQVLVRSLNEANRPQFKNLSTKRKDELLLILQQLKDTQNDGELEENEENYGIMSEGAK